MKILIYDTECTKLDTESGIIQEIAWAVFDVKDCFMELTNQWRCLKAKSVLLHHGMNYEIDPGALEVTGLVPEFCEQHGENAGSVLSEFMADCIKADFIGGHNSIGYDNKILFSNLIRVFSGDDRMTLEIKAIFEKLKFIDSMVHIDYPKHCKSLTLKYLALEHGYVLTGAHEALQDVFACAHLFKSYDVFEVIKNSQEPVQERFCNLKFGDPRVSVLKANRFYWNPMRKVWYKNVRANKVEDLHKILGFETELFMTQQELKGTH